MKNIFFFLIGISLSFSTYSQYRFFEWTDSVDGNWQGEDVKANIDSRVHIMGNYMCKTVCDFTNSWKCELAIKLFEYQENSFKPINPQDLFKGDGKELLDIANLKLNQCYKEGQGKVHDCFVGMDDPGYQDWKGIQVEFTEKGLLLMYNFDSGDYCDAYNWSDTLVSWAKVKPLLKNSISSTPNFCTPSGPKVNIRMDQSAKAEVLFQLDKGQFFEILETGKSDKVNGKPGFWYKINFEGKTGYIFSFYTLCKG